MHCGLGGFYFGLFTSMGFTSQRDVPFTLVVKGEMFPKRATAGLILSLFDPVGVVLKLSGRLPVEIKSVPEGPGSSILLVGLLKDKNHQNKTVGLHAFNIFPCFLLLFFKGAKTPTSQSWPGQEWLCPQRRCSSPWSTPKFGCKKDVRVVICRYVG